MLYVFQTRTYDNIDAMDEVLVFKTEAERTAYIAEFEKAIAENDMIQYHIHDVDFTDLQTALVDLKNLYKDEEDWITIPEIGEITWNLLNFGLII